MEKTVLGLLILAVGLSFTAAFASPLDFQNKEISASLADGKQIHIQFTDDLYPMIDNAYILGNSEFSLADTPIRIHQNGFLVTVPESGWFLTAAKTKTGNYSLQLNEWTGKQFLTTKFEAELQAVKPVAAPIDIPEQTGLPEKSFAWKAPSEPKIDMIILVEQDMRNFWMDNYDIDVKVFDKKLNPNPKFLDTFGAINNATVKVTLVREDMSTYDTISGQTSKIGLWNGDYIIPDNKKIGKYNVYVQVDYKESSAEQSLEMFIFGLGQTPATATE